MIMLEYYILYKLGMKIVFLFLFTFSSYCHAQFDYFDQPVPQDSAKLFAPNLISLKHRYEQNISFSPDGKECIVVVSEKYWNSFTMLHSIKTNNIWSKFDTISFSKGYNMTLEPFYANHGNELYFTSNRLPSIDKWDTDIWKVYKINDKWNVPERLSININQPDKGQWFPSIADNGNIYFIQADISDEKSDIYFSINNKGIYSTPIKLPDFINSEKMEWDALIAKDESYLIFTSRYRDDCYGGQDLYISFKNEKNEWMKAKHLGKEINSDMWEQSPSLSPDGKYLFFDRLDVNTWQGDIYWIDINFIKKYR